MTATPCDRVPRDGARYPLGRALGVIALSTGIILGVIAVDAYVSTLLAVLLGLLHPVAMTVALAVRGDGDGNRGFRENASGWIAVMAVAALFAYPAGVDARHNLILRSGENVSAVVLFEKVENTGRGSKTWSYTLIPRNPTVDLPSGDLEQDSHRFKPGDIVTVRVDPAGRVAPKLPGEADSPGSLLGFLGLNAAIDAVVLWAARPARPSRPPRPPGPVRRRLAERGRRARERIVRLTGWPFALAAGVLSAAWLGLFRLARFDPTLTVMAGVAYFFVMAGFFGMFDDDEPRNAFRARAVLLTVLTTTALGTLLLTAT